MPLPSTSQLGRIVGGGRSYQLTRDDVLWLARAVACEGGNPAATAWTYAWRYITKRFSGSFASMVRSHSQTVNPAWDDPIDARCVDHPDHCTVAAIARRERCASASWESIPSSIRSIVIAWATARQPNPAPRATDFADAVVSRGFLNRNPGARVVLRAGNWYIAEQPNLPANYVVIEHDGRVAGAAAVAGGALLLGAAAFAGWAYWRSRQKRRRGLGDVEYEVAPREGSRRQFCKPVKIRVVENRSKFWNTVAATAFVDGQSVGVVEGTYVKNRPFLTVNHASMYDGGDNISRPEKADMTGCGIGTKLYEALASFACDRELTLRSDSGRSEYSEGFWRKQVQRGRAYEDGAQFVGGREVPTHYVLKSSLCSGRIDLSGISGRR